MADIIIDVETRANLRPLGEGLSAATAKASEFEKSINAANARVLAFGASAGLIYKIGEAFTGLVKSTIEVEKSLTDVNTLLGKSQSELANFGAELFSVAKQTSQSFAVVAEAAKELARQGLTSGQTLERTSEAMNLMRLSGLDASSSVETLTAVLNTFSQAGLNATSVVEKMAAVDAKFAVSSNQLAEGLKRSSAAAVDAGVSYEELLGVITVVQERTARGGAVIGNAFKTIFTKLGRPEVLDDLQNLGVKVRDIQGEILPSIQILKNLASSYESLGPASKSFISEQIAGIYQIGTLKALMADLSKENSRFAETQLVAADSSGSTAKRVAELNTTLDAYINRLGTAAKAFAAAFGAAGFNQGLKDLVGFGTSVLESLTPDPSKSEEIGNKIGVGIMKGLGGFLTGPGLLGAGFIGGKILVKFFSDAAQAAHSLASIGNIINKELQQRQSLETAIALHLQKQPGYIDQIRNGTLNVSTAQDQILLKLKQEEVLRQKILAISSAMAPGLIAGGVGTTPRGGLGLGTKSKGYIPQFARREEISGAIEGGYMPGQVVRSPVGGVMNTAESLKYASGFTQPFINPPKDSKAGRAHRAKALGKTGIDPYSAGGFVPNFATTTKTAKALGYGYGRVGRGLGHTSKKLQLSDTFTVTEKETKELTKEKNYQAFENRALIAFGVPPFKAAHGMFYGGSGAVDGYRPPKGKTVDLLESKNYSDISLGNTKVLDKFFRAVPEQVGQKNDLGELLTTGQDDINVNAYLAKAKAGGFVPNFAPVTGGKFYDFDETLVRYPENTNPRELYFPESVSKASLTPLGRSLVGTKNPINVLTAREINSREAIHNFLTRSRIPVNKVVTSGSMFKRLGLNSSEKKAEFASRIYQKHGQPMSLVDDSFQNVRGFENLNNPDITAKLYKTRGQKGLGQSFNAGGFVPNFAEFFKYPFTQKIRGRDRPVPPSEISGRFKEYEDQLFNGGLASLGFSDVNDLNKLFNSNVEADFFARRNDNPYIIDAKAGYNDAQAGSYMKKIGPEGTFAKLKSNPKFLDFLTSKKVSVNNLREAMVFGNMGVLQENTLSKRGLMKASGFVPNFGTVYRGVNPKYGDTDRGRMSKGIINKLIGAIGPNYTDNEDIAEVFGSQVLSKKVNDKKLLRLGSYDEVAQLFELNQHLMTPGLAGRIKNSTGEEQQAAIEQAGGELRAILKKRKFSGIKSPLHPADAKYLSEEKGLGAGNLIIPFAGGFVPNFYGKEAPGKIGEGARNYVLEREMNGEKFAFKVPKKTGSRRGEAITDAEEQEAMSAMYEKALAPYAPWKAVKQTHVRGGVVKQSLVTGETLGKTLRQAFPHGEGGPQGAMQSFKLFLREIAVKSRIPEVDGFGLSGNIIVPTQHKEQAIEAFRKNLNLRPLLDGSRVGLPNQSLQMIDYAKGFVPNFGMNLDDADQEFIRANIKGIRRADKIGALNFGSPFMMAKAGGPATYEQLAGFGDPRIADRLRGIVGKKGGRAAVLKSISAAGGFVPNFASYMDNVAGLEAGLSGEKATFHTSPFPHFRNESQPTFASAMSDHGGLSNALKDSVTGQKAAGLMAAGGVPNFATPRPYRLSGGPVDTAAGGDPASAKKEFERIINALRSAAMNAEQANEAFKTLKTSAGLTATSQTRLGAIVDKNVKAAAAAAAAAPASGGFFARSKGFIMGTDASGAPLKGDEASNRTLKLGMLSMGLSTAGGVASQLGGPDNPVAKGISTAANIGSYASMGAAFGPHGAAIGLGVGAAIELTKAFDKTEENAKKAAEKTALLNGAFDGASRQIDILIGSVDRLANASSEAEKAVIRQEQAVAAQALQNNFDTLKKEKVFTEADEGKIEKLMAEGNFKEAKTAMAKGATVKKARGDLSFALSKKGAEGKSEEAIQDQQRTAIGALIAAQGSGKDNTNLIDTLISLSGGRSKKTLRAPEVKEFLGEEVITSLGDLSLENRQRALKTFLAQLEIANKTQKVLNTSGAKDIKIANDIEAAYLGYEKAVRESSFAFELGFNKQVFDNLNAAMDGDFKIAIMEASGSLDKFTKNNLNAANETAKLKDTLAVDASKVDADLAKANRTSANAMLKQVGKAQIDPITKEDYRGYLEQMTSEDEDARENGRQNMLDNLNKQKKDAGDNETPQNKALRESLIKLGENNEDAAQKIKVLVEKYGNESVILERKRIENEKQLKAAGELAYSMSLTASSYKRLQDSIEDSVQAFSETAQSGLETSRLQEDLQEQNDAIFGGLIPADKKVSDFNKSSAKQLEDSRATINKNRKKQEEDAGALYIREKDSFGYETGTTKDLRSMSTTDIDNLKAELAESIENDPAINRKATENQLALIESYIAAERAVRTGEAAHVRLTNGINDRRVVVVNAANIERSETARFAEAMSAATRAFQDLELEIQQSVEQFSRRAQYGLDLSRLKQDNLGQQAGIFSGNLPSALVSQMNYRTSSARELEDAQARINKANETARVTKQELLSRGSETSEDGFGRALEQGTVGEYRDKLAGDLTLEANALKKGEINEQIKLIDQYLAARKLVETESKAKVDLINNIKLLSAEHARQAKIMTEFSDAKEISDARIGARGSIRSESAQITRENYLTRDMSSAFAPGGFQGAELTSQRALDVFNSRGALADKQESRTGDKAKLQEILGSTVDKGTRDNLQAQINDLTRQNLQDVEKQRIEEEKINGIYTLRLKQLEESRELSNITKTFFTDLAKASDPIANLQRDMKNLSGSMQKGFEDAFVSFVEGTASAGDAFKGFVRGIAQEIVRMSAKFTANLVMSNFMQGANQIGSALFGGKSEGGLIKANSGGYITGGSGHKDDLPAMLTGGEYVLKKSAVNKYGVDFLNNVNAQKFAAGGQVLDNKYTLGTFSGDYAKGDSAKLAGAYTGKTMFVDGADIGGGSFTMGQYNMDPRLSNIALTDENNPQNRLREEQAQLDRDRKNAFEDYSTEKRFALDSFKKEKDDRRKAAYINAAVQIGMMGLQAGLSGGKAGAKAGAAKADSAAATADVAGGGNAASYDSLESYQQAGGGADMDQKQFDSIGRGARLNASGYKGSVGPTSYLGGFMGAFTGNKPQYQVDGSAIGGDRLLSAEEFQGHQTEFATKQGLSPQAQKQGFIAKQFDSLFKKIAPETYKNEQALKSMTPVQKQQNAFTKYQEANRGRGAYQGKALGGSISGGKDDVPALLMGGEYVMSKSAVSKYGANFMDKLNKGNVQGFAAGGRVGEAPDSGAEGQGEAASFGPDLLLAIEGLTAEIKNKSGGDSKSSGSGGITNNVTVNINVTETGKVTGSNETSGEGGEEKEGKNEKDGQEDQKKRKDMADTIQALVITTLIKEQRAGGLLEKTK